VLVAPVVAVHGRDAPEVLERKARGQTQHHAAHQAAEQERSPRGTQAVLEPVPGEMKFEVVRLGGMTISRATYEPG